MDDDGHDDHMVIQPGGPPYVARPLTDEEEGDNNRRKLTSEHDYTIYHGMTTMGFTGYTWNKANIQQQNRGLRLPTVAELEGMKQQYIRRDGDLSLLPAYGKQWVPVQENNDWYHVATGTMHGTLLSISGITFGYLDVQLGPNTTDVDLPYNGAIYYTSGTDYTTSWDTWPLGFQHFHGTTTPGGLIEIGPNENTLNLGYYAVVDRTDETLTSWEHIPSANAVHYYDLLLNPDPEPAVVGNGTAWHPVSASSKDQEPWEPKDVKINLYSLFDAITEIDTTPLPITFTTIDVNNPPAYIDAGVGSTGIHYHLKYALTWDSVAWYKVDVNNDGLFRYPHDYTINLYELCDDIGHDGPDVLDYDNREGVLNNYPVILPTVEQMWTLYVTTYRSFFTGADYTWSVGRRSEDPNPISHCAMLPYHS